MVIFPDTYSGIRIVFLRESNKKLLNKTEEGWNVGIIAAKYKSSSSSMYNNNNFS